MLSSELSKAAVFQRCPYLLGKVVVEIKIMHYRKPESEHLAGSEQMADICS